MSQRSYCCHDSVSVWSVLRPLKLEYILTKSEVHRLLPLISRLSLSDFFCFKFIFYFIEKVIELVIVVTNTISAKFIVCLSMWSTMMSTGFTSSYKERGGPLSLIGLTTAVIGILIQGDCHAFLWLSLGALSAVALLLCTPKPNSA